MDRTFNLDPDAARLVGLWHAVPEWDGGIATHFRFLHDLKYIGVFNGCVQVGDQPMKYRWQFMRVWMELEPNFVLRCRYKIGGASWTRTFRFEGETLILDATEPLKEGEPEPEPKLYRCHRITVADLPEGMEAEFARAMAKEWT